MTTKEKHKQRLELYCQGRPDREIAKAAGVTASAITCWRIRHGLAPNYGSGVSMEEALTIDQCKEMKRFLSQLLKYDGIAREYGKSLDLTVFMKKYRVGFSEKAG